MLLTGLDDFRSVGGSFHPGGGVGFLWMFCCMAGCATSMGGKPGANALAGCGFKMDGCPPACVDTGLETS